MLRVEWDAPVGGASVVGYIIRYTDSDGNSGIASSDSTSVVIDIDTSVMYTITVEARSEHLSGESEPWVYELGKSILH